MSGLSICIITKNECEKLRRCLTSFAGTGAELVVVDTGSTDGTLDMLKELDVLVGHFDWIGDFAAARNYAASLASCDNILTIDSDEWLCDGNITKLSDKLTGNPKSIAKIKIINLIERDGEKSENYEYIYRGYNRKEYSFEGKIHEQLVRRDGEVRYETESEIVIYHDGYSGSKDEVHDKAMRNVKLLLTELESQGEDPYILYQLGKSYYMAGEYKNASEYFGKALYFDLDPKLEYVIDMVESYGYALLNSGQAQDALCLEGVYDDFGDSADFRFLMGLIYMNNQRFDAAVNEFLAATEYKSSRMKGTNSYLAYYNAGVIMECLGYKEEAKTLYLQCGDYHKALDRLKEGL